MKREHTFSEQFAEFARMSRELTKRTGEFDQLMQAINHLSLALQDEKQFQKMISLLAQWDQQKPSSSPKSSKGDDDLYHLFNSPTMKEIVREVLQRRRKP